MVMIVRVMAVGATLTTLARACVPETLTAFGHLTLLIFSICVTVSSTISVVFLKLLHLFLGEFELPHHDLKDRHDLVQNEYNLLR